MMANQKAKSGGSHRKAKRNPRGAKTMNAIIDKNQGFLVKSLGAEKSNSVPVDLPLVTKEATMHEPTRKKMPPKSLRRPLEATATTPEKTGRRKRNLTRGGKRREDAERISMGPARSFQTKRKPYTGAQPNKEDRPKF
jgi:hypothetical protein